MPESLQAVVGAPLMAPSARPGIRIDGLLATGLMVVAAVLGGCSPPPETNSVGEAAMSMEQLHSDLEFLADSRVFFGHQSVGDNILDGVRDLAQKAGVALRVEAVAVGGEIPEGPGLFHARVGANLDPDSKIAAFSAALGTVGASGYDLAVLKFCYVDLDDKSREQQPQALFARYLAGMNAIEKAHPQLHVLNSTMPLVAEPPGRKTRLKRLLGMSVETDAENVRRNEYNRLVRERYAGSSLLDIARFEATDVDGRPVVFEHSGQSMEMLVPEFTTDGGHLNDAGQEWVAAAFIHRLAEALRERQAGS